MTTIRTIDQTNKTEVETIHTNPHEATKHFLTLTDKLNLDNPIFTPFGYTKAGGTGYSHKVLVIREDKLS